MKVIQILKLLINIFFYCLIIALGIGLVFLIGIIFFNDSLPAYLQLYKKMFGIYFSWKIFLTPFITVINYILFILGVYHLRKTIKPFIKHNFFTPTIIGSLKTSGRLFIFIGVSTILTRLVSVIFIQSMTQNMVLGQSSEWLTITPIISSLDLVYTFLIIIGLFLLLFSNAFNNAYELKQENDLTI